MHESKDPPATPSAAPTRAGGTQADEPPDLQGHVLLAEDSRDTQILIRRLLMRAGVTVEAVGDGLQAVQKGLSQDFDLVVLDIQMPHMDGVEAARLLRGAGMSCPIVALTANANPSDVSLYLASGFDRVLAKPIDRRAFFDALASLLPARGTADARGAIKAELEAMPGWERLALGFRTRLPEEAARIEAALSSGAWEVARAELHRWRGSAASFGLLELTELAGSAEEAIRSGRLDEAAEQTRRALTFVENLPLPTGAHPCPPHPDT